MMSFFYQNTFHTSSFLTYEKYDQNFRMMINPTDAWNVAGDFFLNDNALEK